jgi:hypothetical protein
VAPGVYSTPGGYIALRHLHCAAPGTCTELHLAFAVICHLIALCVRCALCAMRYALCAIYGLWAIYGLDGLWAMGYEQTARHLASALRHLHCAAPALSCI